MEVTCSCGSLHPSNLNNDGNLKFLGIRASHISSNRSRGPNTFYSSTICVFFIELASRYDELCPTSFGFGDEGRP